MAKVSWCVWRNCWDIVNGLIKSLWLCEAYGVEENRLILIQNYLSQRQQKVKVGSSLSEWLGIIVEVPQGSILGPILFNVFINDMLLFIKETYICNFANDTTLYACGKELDTIFFKLKIETNTAIHGLEIMKW